MKNNTFNVRDYGALGIAVSAEFLVATVLKFKWLEYPQGASAQIYRAQPGKELDSVGIQQAIDAAHSAGGGTVFVPAGDYLIGPIELRSNVCLHLDAGARLWGSPDISDYALLPGQKLPAYTLGNGFNRASEGLTRENRRLISANGAENIAITGYGSISGQSAAFVIPWLNGRPEDLLSLHRPQDTFLFFQCSRVALEGIAVFDTPAWSIVFDSCDGVRVDGVTLRSFDIVNSDGIDLVNTSNATISNCRLHCTDDAICLKNSKPGVTMRNIVVTNCVIRTLCNGFKIGTDSAGNFEDITVDNVVMSCEEGGFGDRGGVNLCALDGGTVRNVNISNLVLRNMFCAFYLYATARKAQQSALGLPVRPGQMEQISITNLQADGTRYPSYIVGHPDLPIRDVHISNIDVRKTRDFSAVPPSGPVPERPDEYPTPFTFGSRDTGDNLPASGLYLRHVESATIQDFRLTSRAVDVRPLIVKEHCIETESRHCHSKVRLKTPEEDSGLPERIASLDLNHAELACQAS